ADILVETTPTNISTGEPGLTHIQKALRSGLHVVTTNKGPLITSFKELKKMAERKQICLRYSGAVGGGTPILDFLDFLRPEGVQSARGILNGTTNYILWRMEKGGVTLNTAMKEAKTLGYAEKDPSLDLKGLDTACKLVIMANHLGMEKRLCEVDIKGIEGLKAADLFEAQRRGRVIRLIGTLDCENGELKVSTEEIPVGSALHVEGCLNALTVKTKLGAQTLIGTGTGGRVTAASVIRDLFYIAHRNWGKTAVTQVAAK
ncbi:MAG: homoserine dehydrogenase, partial [Candidatus Bathyarchaeia archaeon]